eukprot:Gb_03830 [translate_table: standard]
MPSRKYPSVASPSPSVYTIQTLQLKTNSNHHLQHSPSNQKALILGFAALGAGFLVVIGFFLYLYYKRLKSNRTSPYDLTGIRLQRFTYSELKVATSSFSPAQKLGKGGFGVVYKGVLRNGKEVAVKKLDVSSLQGEREFQNELSIVGGLRSPFIVSLLGYCADGNKRRLLVYEYMQNRSLQEALFENSDLPCKLDWEKRFNLILDVAQALAFLHLECDPPIIHGDVKPSNVLLDSNFNARIADFGLARIKCDDFYYPDMFSQDLGRSQELLGRSQDLWKSQDLLKSQDLARIIEGKDQPEANSDASDDERLMKSRAHEDHGEGSIGKVSSRKMENFNIAIDMDVPVKEQKGAQDVEDNELNTKGKEIVSDHLGYGKQKVEAEDWIKICPSEEGTDWSKELQVLPPDNIKKDQKKKAWGKDWRWRHDDSGELNAKDYVMEWIGSQIRPSRSLDGEKRRKREKRKRIPDEPSGEIITPTESMRKTDGKKDKRKPRKIKEWWKEEYFAEISKKSRKMRKLETIKWKKTHSIDLHKFDIRRNSRTDSRGRDDHNGDMSFGREWRNRDKIRRDFSAGSEMWSGDLLSRDLSSTTSMRGTVCYIPPEYGGCGFLSEKGDIYSFGVLMLVIISGRRPLHVLASPMKDFEKANLISWARHLAQTGNILELVSDSLKEIYDKDQANLCITLGLLCLQRIPEMRPDISEIVKILKGEMDAPTLPLEFSPSPPCRLLNKSKRKPISDVVDSADFP